MRVLVVDDAPDVREYFLSFAQSIGLNCEVAADGFEACEIIDRNKNTPFNIVFADWKMPGMNGIELTRRIKDNFGAKVVVIMISTTQWSDICNEARAAGVDRFLPKPLFSSLIVDCINECLGLAQAKEKEKVETCSSEPEENIFAGRRVLLAEDIEITGKSWWLCSSTPG
jgi:FOG: CheY-like receiver